MANRRMKFLFRISPSPSMYYSWYLSLMLLISHLLRRNIYDSVSTVAKFFEAVTHPRTRTFLFLLRSLTTQTVRTSGRMLLAGGPWHHQEATRVIQMEFVYR